MTFTELKTEIKDRLGYTSTTADTRVGRLINKIYREVGTSIGMSFARQTNTSEVVTIGNANVTFSETEKILQVWRLDGSSNPVILSEVLLTELREAVIPTSDKPTSWALVSTTSNGVTIRLNASPSTAYTLYADVIAEVSDLSGSNEPAFPESFHDIIIEGVLKDEYRKLEKLQLSRDSEATFQRRLSDLRMFVAKSAYLDIQQGKVPSAASTRASSGTASQAVTGAASSTDNAVVRWNGTGGTSIQNSGITVDDSDNVSIPANASVTMATGTGIFTVPNTGLHIFDTDASHDLIVKPGSNLTADRTLTVTTGDAARTLTISGDATVSQDYSTAGSPQFTGLTLTGALAEQGDGTVTGSLTFDADALHILDTNASHDLIITPGSDLTADRVLTLTTGDAARTVTISGNTTISQDYSTAGSPQFTGIELGHATDTTLTRSSAGNVAIEGNVVYRASGTDVALADGGTGASLTDPNADRIMFWDDSAGSVAFLTAGSGLTITDTTITASASGGMEQIFRGLHLRTSPNADVAATTVTLLRADAIMLDDGTYVEDWDDLSAVISSSGAGGLDTGAEAASTWYEIYAIRKSSDSTKNLLLHRAKDYFNDEEQTTDNEGRQLRGATVNVKLAQSFDTDTTGSVEFADLKLDKIGSPTGRVWFTLEADSAGSPSGTALATSDKLDVASISTTAQWIRFVFRSPTSLTAGTTYWIVAQGDFTLSDVNYLRWRDNSAGGYAAGTMKKTDDGTSWSDLSVDADFKIYVTRNDAAVTMPSGYDQKAKVGYVYNNSSSDLIGFVARDRWTQTFGVGSASAVTATNSTLIDLSAGWLPPSPVMVECWSRATVGDATVSVGGVPGGYALTIGPEGTEDVGAIGDGHRAGHLEINRSASIGFIFTEFQAVYGRVNANTGNLSFPSYIW